MIIYILNLLEREQNNLFVFINMKPVVRMILDIQHTESQPF